MKKRLFLVGAIFLLFSLSFFGCGVSQDKYDAVVTDLDRSQQELQSVKTDLGVSQQELQSTEAELDAKLKELKAANTEIAVQNSTLTSLQSEKESLFAEKASLQTNFNKLNDENKSVTQELASIKSIFPPRHFSSKQELKDWLLKNDVSERPTSILAEALYEKALDIQEAALKDGYIISTYIDYFIDSDTFVIVLEAIASGDVYVFNPESDDLLNLSEVSGLMKVGQ